VRQDESLSPAADRMATHLVRDRGQIKHRVLIIIDGVKILVKNCLGRTRMSCLKQSTANS
jgi:hypothetical protein